MLHNSLIACKRCVYSESQLSPLKVEPLNCLILQLARLESNCDGNCWPVSLKRVIRKFLANSSITLLWVAVFNFFTEESQK